MQPLTPPNQEIESALLNDASVADQTSSLTGFDPALLIGNNACVELSDKDEEFDHITCYDQCERFSPAQLPAGVLQAPFFVRWPESLIATRFFEPCTSHATLRRGHLNHFCLRCSTTSGTLLCKHCLPDHEEKCGGRCIQIFRFMCHDVVRVNDVEDLIDVDGIQQFRAYNHSAVHLRSMETATHPSPYTDRCGGKFCNRYLDPSWKYCSLACKFGLRYSDCSIPGQGVVNSVHQTPSVEVPLPPQGEMDAELFRAVESGDLAKVKRFLLPSLNLLPVRRFLKQSQH